MPRRVRPRAVLAAAARTARRTRDVRADLRLVRDSGLFDREWVGLQLGRQFDDDDTAIRTFLEAGAYLSPHPLFEIDWIDPAHRFADDGLNQLLWYLRDDAARQRSPHPLLDVKRIVRLLPGADEHPHGPVAAWLAQATPDTSLPSPPHLPRTTLGRFRDSAFEAVGRHLSDTAPLRTRRLTDDHVDVPVPLPPLVATDEPLVSIVMPTWNRAHLLRAAIASVQAQSWPHWELLVVDDGSDDDTRAVLAGITAFDPRVRALPVDHGGVSRARNHAIAHARGRYVAFLDSDNRWRPDFLRVVLEHLVTHDWQMAHSVLAMEREGRSVFRVLEGTRTDLLVGNYVDLNVLVVATDLVREIGGFDETLRRAVDYDLVLRLSARTDLHLVPYVGTDYSENPDDPHRISVREPVSWLSVVLGRHLLDWDAVAGADVVPGRVSVVLPTRGNLARTVAWIQGTVPTDRGVDAADLELVVTGTRTRRSHRVVVEELAALYPHVRVKAVIANVSSTLSAVVGATAATGEHLVFVRPEVAMTRADVLALAEPLTDGDVAVTQPLVVDPRGVVLSAGAVFGSVSRPEPFLAGHPVSDARATGPLDVPAPFSPVVATSRRRFVDLRGFDPHFDQALMEVDYALRSGGRTVLQPAAVAHHPSSDLIRPRTYVPAASLLERTFPLPPEGSSAAWAAAGFEVVGRRNVPVSPRRRSRGPNDEVFLLPRAVVRPLGGQTRLEVREGLPGLRWTLDLAAPAGPRGESWGDTHFARSLAGALRSLGQRVAVDTREARHRESRDLDDVLLVLRGLDRGQPRPGLLNVEWVISHPELVTREEAAGFDLVYAAGRPWATAKAQQWGREIRPLLQCTDPALFHPGLMDVDVEGPQHLFVGNSRKVFRTSVRAALAAGIDLTIYGVGWSAFVDPSHVAGTYVPNVELGTLYATSGVVLNDHWEDMRRDGFLSNRLFDAAACGARIVSDDVDGLEDVFGGQVQRFHDEHDMGALLRDPAAYFPSREERRRSAARVVAAHSFDARAEVLVRDAAERLRRAGSRSGA